jgi:spore coat polysaccharide biosynthesis protein SpsF
MRKLVAALACRAAGSRLYGKPLQLLDVARGISVLDHMIALYRTEKCIAEIVLGVAEGVENEIFHEVARERGVRSIRGDERDVLRRLIQCAEATQATDVFRVTTESPFTHIEPLAEAWRLHVERGHDVTVTDRVPEGAHFEIYTIGALRRSHDNGNERHRSEMCSLYVREHRDQFNVFVMPLPAAVQRMDLRLTIDYPEDLVLCRKVYEALADRAPRLPLPEIIAFLDSRPDLRALVAPYVVPTPLY